MAILLELLGAIIVVALVIRGIIGFVQDFRTRRRY